MNVIAQHDEVVHIAMHNKLKLDIAEQEMAITMLTQLVEVQYNGAVLSITRGKYNNVIDVSVRFNNIEDATHFKLTHMRAE